METVDDSRGVVSGTGERVSAPEQFSWKPSYVCDSLVGEMDQEDYRKIKGELR